MSSLAETQSIGAATPAASSGRRNRDILAHRHPEFDLNRRRATACGGANGRRREFERIYFGRLPASTGGGGDTARRREGDGDRRAQTPVRRRERPPVDPSLLASSATSRRGDAAAASAQSLWQTTADPRSGKTYYWNVLTRESRWKKPIELATAEERGVIEKKEKETKEFFAEMEANILRKMASKSSSDVGTPASLALSFDDAGSSDGSAAGAGIRDERDDEVPPLAEDGNRRAPADRPKHVRTISSMEGDLVSQLRTPSAAHDGEDERSTPDARSEEAPKVAASVKLLSALKLTDEAEGVGRILLGNDLESAPPSRRTGLAKPPLTKRNTCGTMYLGSTLSAPDKDALIKCVCGVFRAHVLLSNRDAAFASTASSEAGAAFDERPTDRTSSKESEPGNDAATAPPSLEDVTAFYSDVFVRSQMECDCIVISLMYVERLITKTGGDVRPNARNWRSVLFASMVLASKVWDDLSMWNRDFSRIGPPGATFSLRRTNELEATMLHCLGFGVEVSAGEYAKYYFHLRSMLQKSGVAGGLDDLARLTPLDAGGARSLEGARGSGVHSGGGARNRPPMPLRASARCKSFGDAESMEEVARRCPKSIDESTGPKVQKKISLEHLVLM